MLENFSFFDLEFSLRFQRLMDIDPSTAGAMLLGQYIHVGKNAVFGNGWYEILNSIH